MMLISIPALNDNYIWCYGRENLPIILVDPSEFKPLNQFLTENNLQVELILLTHKHDDHIGGVAELKSAYPNVPIYGPTETADKGATHIINEGLICSENYQVQVIPTGGHTENHVSYLVDNHLFCGDTIFSAGCGRVFTQDYELMFNSLQRLNQLPAQIIVCPAHEYTLSNLAFAEQAMQNMQDKSAVQKHQSFVQSLRSQGLSSLPTTLELERQINPFLQAKNLQEFIALRLAKDKF